MKPLAFLLCALWFLYLQFVLLSSFNLLLQVQPSRTASALGNETDYLALLKFRESISNDPYDILAFWNSSTHFCNWPGIRCSQRHRQRVTSLELPGSALHGFISPHVGNLSFLRTLNLRNNSFSSIIPQELGRLSRLQQLWLTNNTLVGGIPSNLTSCSELKSLNLAGNRLAGHIPMKIGALHKLQELYLSRNNLSGQFPASLWNLSSLDTLHVGQNNLEGKIPEEIGQLNLKYFRIYVNQLSGMLPSSLYNISSLILISIVDNKFKGSLPSNMFLNLPNLQLFYAGMNQFSGPIPNSIVNASKLEEIDVKENNFVGQVPKFGRLKDLQYLNLGHNDIGSNSSEDWKLLTSLINCTKLQILDIDKNNFGGTLPDLIGNFSNQLSELYLGSNPMYGKIPETLGKLINLIAFTIEDTNVTGELPDTFGRLQKLQRLSLWGNKFSGKIPTSIGNLTQLYHLDLFHNLLEGNIPPSIDNCKNLQILDLSKNNLSGAIPIEIFGLLSLLIVLDLSQNSLSGNLPSEVGKLTNINTLDVSRNHLVGDIPKTIGDCMSLESLSLQGNLFYGNIPSSLALLKGLQQLDLSKNNLSGSIPELLQNISVLEYLNVSFNMLEGEVPKEGVFRNASQLSVVGNDMLCGGISELHLPPCIDNVRKQSKYHDLILIIAIVSGVGFFLLPSLLAMYWIRIRTRKSSSTSLSIDQFSKVSYQSLHIATNGFSTSNMIGSGSYGSVYKGRLEFENSIVAIKVFNLQKKGAHKSFIAECNALKSIRHRNLVKILTCCSSLDYKGVGFKALVFEYMNGSLEQWLHPKKENEDQLRTLDLNQRLNILIDIASVLQYLHYECEQPVIHCDLKPSNILLDDDMVAHVSDFGLARILSTINNKQTSTTGIKGTIGYVPPEYGIDSELSTKGDLYSFGILMLELLTRKRPTDEMFKDGQNLHNYVKMTFPNDVVQVLDPFLVQRETTREYENMESFPMTYPNKEKCLVSLFEIGLACSMESPQERMNIVEVSRRLNQIKNAF